MKAKRVARFKEGRRYRCMGGTMVTVLQCVGVRGYETVRCSDVSENAPNGVHRYNRSTGRGVDQGRVTGTAHDFSDPRNLDPRQIGLPLRQPSS
jgi:hypothetical protein